jgi:cysteine-rich repeat protein
MVEAVPPHETRQSFDAPRRSGSLATSIIPVLLSLLGFASCGGSEQRYVFSDLGGAAGSGGVGGRPMVAGGTGGSILAPPGGSTPNAVLGTACPVNGSKECLAEQKQRAVCQDGVWRAETACAATENCERDSGQCKPAIAECKGQTSGYRFCDEAGNSVSCGLDLVSVETEACGGKCLQGECVPLGCGNGTLEPPEQCDDGNQVDTDACTNLCRPAACGDGFQQPGEDCDDGNDLASDACNECRSSSCGDGVIQSTEECDDQNQDAADACTNACKVRRCGDGIVQSGEGCDDGNLDNGDACTNACVAGTCGDAVMQGNEGCDDGNPIDNDGCSNACQLAKCGDGVVQLVTGEACDDGNTSETDACNADCQKATCGDGVIQTEIGEVCDDGNTIANDACTNSCQKPSCGDSIVQPALDEACDDGMATEKCTALCRVPDCGDGITQANEVCDDGNLSNTDDCTTACKKPACNDGFLQAGESCDDGNTNNLDGCTTECEKAACGDGIHQLNEECEDGNTVDTDMCTSQCRTARCGDSIKATHEGCEDGNTIDTDMCTALCTVAKCGDHVQASHEQCDDHNTVNNDDCTAECKTAICGDNIIQPVLGENCDDGNTAPMDTCSHRCHKNKPLSDSSNHTGCDTIAEARTGGCVAAARRYCTALDGLAGGLIQESNATTVAFGMGCFATGSSRFNVDASEVKKFNEDGCTGSPQSAACTTAARDFCKTKNSSFEFGMIQENNTSNDPTMWLVICVPAQRVTVSLATLAAEVDGNCSAAQLAGLEQSCVSAAHRLCQDRVNDQKLGGGMIMDVSDTSKVQVACLKFGFYGDVPLK